MGWVGDFIINEIGKRITSWQTTVPGALIAYITNAVSAYIDPVYLHTFVGQVAQWLLYGAALILLAWKNRKQPTQDNTPTLGPIGDN